MTMPGSKPLQRRQFLAGGFAILASSASLKPVLADEPVRMSFVLTNDLYKISEDKGRGGVARLAALLKTERMSGNTTLFTHAGDALSPSLISGFDQGEAMLDMLNQLHPDLFVPGNHEFDFGKDIFLKRMSEAHFPLLAANMRMASGGNVPGFVDQVNLEVAGIRIGISGAVLDETAKISSPGDIQITDALTALSENARQLRKNGADFTVALVHADKSTIQKLAATRAYDVIISGHNHDLALDYDGRTLTAESEEEARHIVILDLAFALTVTKDKRALSWFPNIRVIDSANLMPDPETLEKVKAYEAKLSKDLDVQIATLKVDLDTREASVRTQETAFGNLVADALKTASHADIALTNGGGIRADKQYPAGTILTRRDILSEMPFGNRTVTIPITGKTLRAALENGVSQIEKPAGRFPQTSGLKILVNRNAEPGHRVETVEVNGQPLDESKTYLLATNDFLLKGGDGYTMLSGSATADSGARLMANDVIDEITRRGNADALIEGRLIFK